MKSALIAASLALAVTSLAGCAQYNSAVNWVGTEIGVINKGSVSALLATNTALANAAPSVGVLAADIQVAYGYFLQIAGTGKISPAAQKLIAKGMVVVNALAANPPSSVASVAGTLAAIKTNIQNLSTVPAAAAVTIPVVAVPATPTTPAISATAVVVPAA